MVPANQLYHNAGAVLMGLFPELDEKKTIDNVKNYFKKEFPRLKARSHMNLTNIQSPSFDSVGPGGSFRNHQEEDRKSVV